MSGRARFFAASVTLIVVLLVAAIAAVGPRGPKTWTIQLHEQLTLPVSAVHSDDVYRCEGWGVVNGTPEVGIADVSEGGSLYVGNVVDGTVAVTCENGVDWAMT